MSSNKQKAILTFLNNLPNKEATLEQIVNCVSEVRTYHNSKHYLSETLGRMIKNGLVIRVKRGVYKVNI